MRLVCLENLHKKSNNCDGSTIDEAVFFSHHNQRYNNVDIECSKQLYFYASGQSGLFWAVLKLLENSNMKFI